MKLSEFLNGAVEKGRVAPELAGVVLGLAEAAKGIDNLIRKNTDINLGAEVGEQNADGDQQKALDILAEELIVEKLKKTNVAVVLSEEQDEHFALKNDGQFVVAIDPLDGSSNIDVNVTVGTIFSLLSFSHYSGPGQFLHPGRAQLGAGFFTYGPQTTLILGFEDVNEVARFVLSPEHDAFVRIKGAVRIPPSTNEFAVNAAYSRHWHEPMQAYMKETLQGADGACGKDYRMRWVGSLVADAWRIFERGGVFLYPSDKRKTYEAGRLRLVYEANPIALLVEKAGGRAVDGTQDILDLMPENLHQRTPFFFGAREEIERIMTAHKKR